MPVGVPGAIFLTIEDADGTAHDWSDWVSRVSLQQDPGMTEVSTFGSATRKYVPTIASGTFSVTFFADFDSDKVIEQLENMAGHEVEVVYKPKAGDTGPANKKRTFSIFVSMHNFQLSFGQVTTGSFSAPLTTAVSVATTD